MLKRVYISSDSEDENEEKNEVKPIQINDGHSSPVNHCLNQSSDQIIIFMGLNDQFKLQNLSFLTRDLRIQNSPILQLENKCQIISYPIKSDLDLKMKVKLWNQIDDLLKEKQLVFVLILDEQKLFQQKKELNDYLQSQLLQLENSVSDVNLLLQLKILTVVVSSIGREQKNGMNEELFSKQMKQLKDKFNQIYWEAQSNIFRKFLYYLIQIFSPEGSYLLLQQQQQSRERLLEQLYQQQSIDSIDCMINPPGDVQDQMDKDCLEKLMQQKLEKCNFDQFKNLFDQFSQKSNMCMQEVYRKIIQKFQQQVLDMINQIKYNRSTQNEYTTLLEQIQMLEMFEQHLSSFNFIKVIKSDDFVQSISDVFQYQLSVLNLNEMNNFLITLSQYSKWNKQFSEQEINLKQKIGSQLNQILRALVDKSESKNFSQNLQNLQEIVDILTNKNQPNINEFFTESLTKEIKNQLVEIQDTCYNSFNIKCMNAKCNKPNFKDILNDLQYFLDIVKVLKVFSCKQQEFQDIFGIDTIMQFKQCEQKVNELKQQLKEIKLDNDNLLIIVLQDKESLKQIYYILNLQLKIDEQYMQDRLISSVKRQEIQLTDLISKKAFGEDFVNKLIELEKCEKFLNNGLIATNRIQNVFKDYYIKFLELYKKINSLDFTLEIKQSLRQEKMNLDKIKQIIKFQNKPQFLIDLLNNLPQNLTK